MTASIIVLPVPTAPAAQATAPELHRELTRANGLILEASAHLVALATMTRSLNGQLAGLVRAHLEGDSDALREQLDALAADYLARVRQAEGLH